MISPDELAHMTMELWTVHGGPKANTLILSLAGNMAAVEMADDTDQDIEELTQQAFHLAEAMDDFNTAAANAGWVEESGGGAWFNSYRHEDITAARCANEHRSYNDAEELCYYERVQPVETPIDDFWIVDDWMAGMLAAAGERVDVNFGGIAIWARPVGRPAPVADPVLATILHNLDQLSAPEESTDPASEVQAFRP